jgi:hypothetical protein
VPYEYVSDEGDDRVAFSSGERLDGGNDDGDVSPAKRIHGGYLGTNEKTELGVPRENQRHRSYLLLLWS